MSETFIPHNLAVVEGLSHREVVMDAGRVVEILSPTPGRGLASLAKHPVTQALLAAIPRLPAPSARPQGRTVVLP